MNRVIRVLYVDDNPFDLELVRDILEKDNGGFLVIASSSQSEFEGKLEEGGYDIVLSDLNILAFRGLQVLDAVRARDPHVPVIIVTGAGSEEVAVEALKKGAADYVLKSSARIRRLPQAIRTALEREGLHWDREPAEAALRDSETMYRELVENISDVIYSVDEKGIVTYISPVVQNAAGYTPEEIVGRPFTDFVEPEDFPLVKDAFQRTVSGQTWRVECRVHTKEGKTIWVRSSTSPKIVGEHVVGFSGVLTDITERKHSEKQVERQLQLITSLHTIDTAISSSLDLHVTLKVIIERVLDSLHADAADVLLLSPHSFVLEYAEGKGFYTLGLKRTTLSMGEGHAGQAVKQRRIVVVDDLSKDPGTLGRAAGFAGEGFVFYCAVPLIAKGLVKGVLEIFRRTRLEPDQDWKGFSEAIATQAAVAIDNAEVFEDLQHSYLELGLSYDATIEGWSRALDIHDRETEGHTLRVAEKAIALARLTGITETQLVHFRRGALLHDIGKMGVPDSILFKPGALTDEELKVMRTHPVDAYNMLSSIAYLRPALEIPLCHHERWDGGGYPRGLKGEEIPLGARIFAIVDVWGALRSDRPYRSAWPDDRVYEYMKSQSGRHFDPRIVEAFLAMER